MERWRVLSSRKTPTWFYAYEVAFVDAETAKDAVQQVESAAGPSETIQAWAVTPATPEMEAARSAQMAAQAEWIRRVKAGENPRGLL